MAKTQSQPTPQDDANQDNLDNANDIDPQEEAELESLLEGDNDTENNDIDDDVNNNDADNDNDL